MVATAASVVAVPPPVVPVVRVAKRGVWSVMAVSVGAHQSYRLVELEKEHQRDRWSHLTLPSKLPRYR
jgi:hypothetical protein